MSTQAAPLTFDSLTTDFNEPESKQVGNACPRVWVYSHASHIFTWQPGEVRPVAEILGPPLDEGNWNKPMPIPPNAYQVVNGVKQVPRHLLVVKQGCSLHEILKGAFAKDGCPLYEVKNDGRDDQRARIALEKWRDWRLPLALHEVEVHLAKCERERVSNLPASPMHPGVRAAKADINDIRRMRDVGAGRYVYRKDNEVFEFLDDAQRYIIENFPEDSENWRMWVTDRVGGDPAYRNKPGTVQPAPVAPATATAGPSASALGIISLAEQSGKVLPPEILARLDTDPAATREAMEFIYAPKPKNAPKNAPKGDAA